MAYALRHHPPRSNWLVMRSYVNSVTEGMGCNGAKEVAGQMDPFPELALIELRLGAKVDKVIEMLDARDK